MKNFFNKIIAILEELNKTKNIVPKLTVLFAAVFLWAYIATIKNDKVRYKIPINFKNLSIKNIVSEVSKDTLIVTFEGKREKLKNIHINSVKAVVDLSQIDEGVLKEYPVRISRRDVPEGIKISQSSDFISVFVEKKSRKRVEVIPDITGVVSENFALLDVKIKPNFIYITGPSSQVSKIDYLYSEEINLDEESYSFAKDVSIVPVSSEKITLDETNVKVFIPIVKFDNLRKIKIPIKIKSINPNYEYELENKKITVYVQLFDDSDLTEDDVIASVDITSIKLAEIITEKNKIKKFKLPIKIIVGSKYSKNKIISNLPKEAMLKISLRE